MARIAVGGFHRETNCFEYAAAQGPQFKGITQSP